MSVRKRRRSAGREVDTWPSSTTAPSGTGQPTSSTSTGGPSTSTRCPAPRFFTSGFDLMRSVVSSDNALTSKVAGKLYAPLILVSENNS